MAPARVTPKYAEGEKVYCMQGELPWEAKIHEVQPVHAPGEKKVIDYEYFVHYQGWKKSWDEWVPNERLWKINEENTEEYSRLHAESKAKREASRNSKSKVANRKSTGNAGSERGSIRNSEDRSSIGAAQGPRGTKRQRENDIEKEEFFQRSAIRFPIPDELKSLLVDDWENITKSLQLVPLPHEHPVNEILQDYLDFEGPKRLPGSADHDILEEVIQGVREYFDKSLGRILLYRFERQQYLQIHEGMMGLVENSDKGKGRANGENEALPDLSGKSPSDVYGAEHLCRLFVSFGELIAQTNMDKPSVDRLRLEVMKLTRWLARNASKYFAPEYENAGSEYERNTKGPT